MLPQILVMDWNQAHKPYDIDLLEPRNQNICSYLATFDQIAVQSKSLSTKIFQFFCPWVPKSWSKY